MNSKNIKKNINKKILLEAIGVNKSFQNIDKQP